LRKESGGGVRRASSWEVLAGEVNCNRYKNVNQQKVLKNSFKTDAASELKAQASNAHSQKSTPGLHQEAQLPKNFVPPKNSPKNDQNRKTVQKISHPIGGSNPGPPG